MDEQQTEAPGPRRLSIVVPVYNERDFLRTILDRIEAVALPGGLEREIVLIDDCSTDGTVGVLKGLETERPDLVIAYHATNRGKGAAVQTGFARTTGDLVLIQDADFEYDPADYPALLEPMLAGRADVVIGSRFVGGRPHRVVRYWHQVGNKLLTILSNMLTNLNLTDMECCYKVFRREVLQRVVLQEPRFGIEPEVVAKVARLGVAIYEVPVSYAGRSYAQGKKINWRDGFSALRCILKYNLLPHAQPGPPAVDPPRPATADRAESTGTARPE